MRMFVRITIRTLGSAIALLCAPVYAGSLMDAVKAGNLPAVQQTLQQHGNANEADLDGTTALHWGVEEQRLDIVQALLEAGADVNARNHLLVTPLAVALTTGDAAITEQLLKSGANPRVPVPEMGTALLAAAYTGNPEVLKALLKAGVDVNEPEPSTKQTALMLAAAAGHEAAVKALLAAGANSRVRSAKDESALFFAVRGGHIGVADALLAAGADVNERAAANAGGRKGGGGGAMNTKVPGDTMLGVAIVNAHFAMANFLLSKGADPNAAGSNWMPLHALARIRDYEEMQYPPPMIVPGDLDSLELGKSLLAHGADPNARGTEAAVRRPGGDQNYKDLLGATPFFLAAKSGDVSYMRLLVSAKADVTIPEIDHTTPLMVAAGVGCVPGQWIETERDVLAAVKLLVEELSADVNAVNDHKETALHGAVCRGADSVIQYLVDKGARLDIKDEDGQTPLDQVVDGLNRAVSINGPRIIIFHFPEHTVALVKKLTEEQRAAASATARR